jgi:hypothetical protein
MPRLIIWPTYLSAKNTHQGIYTKRIQEKVNQNEMK